MKRLFLSIVTFLTVIILTLSATACGGKVKDDTEETPPEQQTEHTEHTFNKGFCECGEIDLTFNTDGLSFALIGEGDTAYYSVTGYSGSDKKVLIAKEYQGKPVKEIGEYAFQGQLNRVNFINIPDTIEKIGKESFDSCTSIKKIVIPKNVKVIGEHAFKNCLNVTEIDYRATECEIEYYKHVEGKSDEKNSYCNPFLMVGTGTDGVTLTIGKTVKSIPYNAFYLGYAYFDEYAPNVSGSPKITSVIFEDDGECTKIGDNAFFNARYLESVSFGNNSKIDTFGNSTFGNCTLLTEITIPTSVTTIGRYTFSACAKLERVNISKLDGWNLYPRTGDDKIEGFNLSTAILHGETENQTFARLMKGDYAKYTWTQIKR